MQGIRYHLGYERRGQLFRRRSVIVIPARFAEDPWPQPLYNLYWRF
ncbi:MAG: hypothetical protein U0X93_04100 [Anaerolineales bacterium]